MKKNYLFLSSILLLTTLSGCSLTPSRTNTTPTPKPTPSTSIPEDSLKLSLSLSSMNLKLSSSKNIKAEVSEGASISWTLSKDGVVSLDKNSGTSINVTGLSVGTVILTAKATKGKNSVSKTCTITVKEEDVDPVLSEDYLEFFNPTSKIEIELDFSNQSLYGLSVYGVSGYYEREMYHPCNAKITVNGKTTEIEEVGARMRGNTSRYYGFVDEEGNFQNREHICHLKLNFSKAFASEEDNDYYYHSYSEAELKARDKRRFADMKKIDLKWNKNYDPSFTKEIYALNAFNEEGLLAQRATLVNLTVKTENDSITMTYMALEAVDKQLIKKRMPIDEVDGDLYKCTYGSYGRPDLTDSSLTGVETEYYNPTYCLKTNEKTSDCSVIKNFIDTTCITGPAEEVKPLIDPLLNKEQYIKYCALSWVVGNPDDLRNNYNNYYLYFSDFDDRAYFLTYDNDRVFGILKDWPIDTSNIDPDYVYAAGSNDEWCYVPLLQRTIIPGSNNSWPIIEEYHSLYIEKCYEYAEKYLDEEKFEEFSNQFYYSSKYYGSYKGNMSFRDYAVIKKGTLI